MRIVFQNHSAEDGPLAGAEKSLLEMVSLWAELDPSLEPIFISRAPGGTFVDETSSRGWAHRLVEFGSWVLPKVHDEPETIVRNSRIDWSATLQIIDILHELQPAAVVTNTIVSPWSAIASGIVGIPHFWFVTEYGDIDHGLKFQIGRDATFADINRMSQLVVANSSAMARHITQWIRPESVVVQYPHVNAPAVIAAAAEQVDAGFRSHRAFAIGDEAAPIGTQTRPLSIAMIGRVAASKGQHRLIAAMGELASRGVFTTARIVGSVDDTEYRDSLIKLAESVGIADRVLIAGNQSNPFPFIAGTDIGVTASDQEAFGRVTLEYMILGKPVIASSTGGSSELVDPDQSGHLVDPGEPGQLVSAIESYVLDPTLLAAHGGAGRSRAELFGENGQFGSATVFATIRAAIAAATPESARTVPNFVESWLQLPDYVDRFNAANDVAKDAGVAIRLDQASQTAEFTMQQELTRMWGRAEQKIEHDVSRERRLAEDRWKREINLLKRQVKQARAGREYRIGRAILKPLRVAKRLITRFTKGFRHAN
jgi:glycosyltransferase involved in cell wall biosynthesis